MSVQPSALLDAITEAALARDQALAAAWWQPLDDAARVAAEASFRRGYQAAWFGGAIETVLPGRTRVAS